MLPSLAPTAWANLALVPTRFETNLNFFALIFSNSKAKEPSAFAVRAAISYLVDTERLTVLRSLVFFNISR